MPVTKDAIQRDSEKVIVAGHKECAGVGRTFSLMGGCLADSRNIAPSKAWERGMPVSG